MRDYLTFDQTTLARLFIDDFDASELTCFHSNVFSDSNYEREKDKLSEKKTLNLIFLFQF